MGKDLIRIGSRKESIKITDSILPQFENFNLKGTLKTGEKINVIKGSRKLTIFMRY